MILSNVRYHHPCNFTLGKVDWFGIVTYLAGFWTSEECSLDRGINCLIYISQLCAESSGNFCVLLTAIHGTIKRPSQFKQQPVQIINCENVGSLLHCHTTKITVSSLFEVNMVLLSALTSCRLTIVNIIRFICTFTQKMCHWFFHSSWINWKSLNQLRWNFFLVCIWFFWKLQLC